MANKVPYRIYLSDETVEALDAAARKTGESTGNQVAADVVTRCLSIWLAAREAFDDSLDQFLRQLIEQADQSRQRRKK